MRIIAGKFRGRNLEAPHSNGIRPTSDRLRESIFNILEHNYDYAADHARVLDLFAGTGACGLEALSRGAEYAVFVDTGTEARGIIRRNIEKLGVGGISRIFRRDATCLGSAHPNQPFSLVFCDPPYGKGLTVTALSSCREGGWLASDALIIAEDEKGVDPLIPADGFEFLEERIYGETRIQFARYRK